MTTLSHINGVDVEQLGHTIEAIKTDPSVAQFNFRAVNRWCSGGHSQTKISDFFGAGEVHRHEPAFKHDEDEPSILLGGDLGANPVEYILTGLAGCLTTSLVYHASARGIRIRQVTSKLDGDIDLHGFLGMDPDIRNGYQGITIVMEVEGDASPEELDELVELAQQRSPVFDIVTNPVPVKVRAVTTQH